MAAGQKGDSSANSALPYLVSLSMLGLLCMPGRLPCSLRPAAAPVAGAAHEMPLPAPPLPLTPPPLLMLLVEAMLLCRRRLVVLGAAASRPPEGSPDPAEPSSGASRSALSPSLTEGAAAPVPRGERGSHLWLRWVKLAPSRRRLLLRGEVADTFLQGGGMRGGGRPSSAVVQAQWREGPVLPSGKVAAQAATQQHSPQVSKRIHPPALGVGARAAGCSPPSRLKNLVLMLQGCMHRRALLLLS